MDCVITLVPPFFEVLKCSTFVKLSLVCCQYDCAIDQLMAKRCCHVIVRLVFFFSFHSLVSLYFSHSISLTMSVFVVVAVRSTEKRKSGKKREPKKKREGKEVDSDEQKHETSRIDSIFLSNAEEKRKKSTYFSPLDNRHSSLERIVSSFLLQEIEKKKRETILFLFCLLTVVNTCLLLC